MKSLAADVLVGGKYRLRAKIGEGGLGEVWAATHDLLGGEIALKFLKSSDSTRPEAVGRFVREARAAASLHSDHVCRVFDVGTFDGVPYIVMERLLGEDFRAIVERDGRVGHRMAAEVVVQACDALYEAHALGIFHRDLKPDNLFVVWRDELPMVKVLDFGLATSSSADMTTERLTATSSTFGTPLYMAPEQLRSAKDADARSDIWSLGVLLFYATTGCYPFDGETFHELCIQIGTQQAPKLETRWPSAPTEFARVVDRCLAHAPAERFQTVDDLANALGPFASTHLRTSRALRFPVKPAPVTVAPPAPMTPSKPPVSDRRRAAVPTPSRFPQIPDWLGSSAMTALLALALGFAFSGPTSAPQPQRGVPLPPSSLVPDGTSQTQQPARPSLTAEPSSAGRTLLVVEPPSAVDPPLTAQKTSSADSGHGARALRP